MANGERTRSGGVGRAVSFAVDGGGVGLFGCAARKPNKPAMYLKDRTAGPE